MLNPLAVVLQQFRHAMINHATPAPAQRRTGPRCSTRSAIVVGVFALGFWSSTARRRTSPRTSSRERATSAATPPRPPVLGRRGYACSRARGRGRRSSHRARVVRGGGVRSSGRSGGRRIGLVTPAVARAAWWRSCSARPRPRRGPATPGRRRAGPGDAARSRACRRVRARAPRPAAGSCSASPKNGR